MLGFLLIEKNPPNTARFFFPLEKQAEMSSSLGCYGAQQAIVDQNPPVSIPSSY